MKAWQRSSIFWASAAVLATTAFAGPVQTTLQGGPLAGLRIGDVMFGNGRNGRGLLPSVPNSSPIPVDDVAAISEFLWAYAAPPPHDYSKALVKDARQVVVATLTNVRNRSRLTICRCLLV